VSSAVATLPDSPIATGVATSAVRGWNGMVAGADGSGGRNWRTVENEEYAVRLRHDFSHADFLGFNLDLQRPMHPVHQHGNFG
jgi:hypothetical protein